MKYQHKDIYRNARFQSKEKRSSQLLGGKKIKLAPDIYSIYLTLGQRSTKRARLWSWPPCASSSWPKSDIQSTCLETLIPFRQSTFMPVQSNNKKCGLSFCISSFSSYFLIIFLYYRSIWFQWTVNKNINQPNKQNTDPLTQIIRKHCSGGHEAILQNPKENTHLNNFIFQYNTIQE